MLRFCRGLFRSLWTVFPLSLLPLPCIPCYCLCALSPLSQLQLMMLAAFLIFCMCVCVWGVWTGHPSQSEMIRALFTSSDGTERDIEVGNTTTQIRPDTLNFYIPQGQVLASPSLLFIRCALLYFVFSYVHASILAIC